MRYKLSFEGGGDWYVLRIMKVYISQLWEKSQNCEIKSCNNLFILYSVAETGLHMSVHGKWLVTRNYDLLVQENFMEKNLNVRKETLWPL